MLFASARRVAVCISVFGSELLPYSGFYVAMNDEEPTHFGGLIFSVAPKTSPLSGCRGSGSGVRSSAYCKQIRVSVTK